jgi:opacity protein-like surface antigen
MVWVMCLLLLPHEGSAEWYGDIYTGAVFTHNTDLTISGSDGTATTYHNLRVNNTWTAGGRVGYWLDKADWLGFGLDTFFFHLKTPPGQTVAVSSPGSTSPSVNADWSLPAFGVGFDVLRVRLPLLRDEEFTHGRLQPFLSAGPTLFITYASQNRYVQPDGQHATNVAVGPKVDAGVQFMLTKTVGLFGQYRFTHFTSKLDYQDTTSGQTVEKTFKSSYDSHQFIAGLSLSF